MGQAPEIAPVMDARHSLITSYGRGTTYASSLFSKTKQCAPCESAVKPSPHLPFAKRRKLLNMHFSLLKVPMLPPAFFSLTPSVYVLHVKWQNKFHTHTKRGKYYSVVFIFCSVAQQPNLGLGRILVEVSTSHTIRHTYTHGRTPPNEWSALNIVFTVHFFN